MLEMMASTFFNVTTVRSHKKKGLLKMIEWKTKSCVEKQQFNNQTTVLPEMCFFCVQTALYVPLPQGCDTVCSHTL